MWIDQIKSALTQAFPGLDIREKESMKLHTTFKIGGPADLFIVPKVEEELTMIIKLCKELDVPLFFIGNGSNLLVGDAGYRGVVVQIYKNFNTVEVKEDGSVIAGAGILLSSLAKKIIKHSYKGFEFASGIPGTLGGAIYMNAGAYGGEMKDCVVEVKAIDGSGQIKTYSKDELLLGYRTSVFQSNDHIIIHVKMKFEIGDHDEITATVRDLAKRRREKQPLEMPSAGSTFKRPEGHYAGKLIMDAGLRGFGMGGASVSEKHCGFVVNTGGATSEDVVRLINHIRRCVFEGFGVEMEPEVRILGEEGLENVKLDQLGG